VSAHYRKPGPFTKHVLNPTVALLTRLGIGVAGSRVLEVRGRKSGKWRSTPVNLLTVDGAEYLVSPRGQSQWVRNIRLTGAGRLRSGQRLRDIQVAELADELKPPILRAYLRRWSWEVGPFFAGVSASSSEADLLRIAPEHPVFRVGSR
jgi:deazaflavin-dependent oxidoreductase (nitroreductase family)